MFQCHHLNSQKNLVASTNHGPICLLAPDQRLITAFEFRFKERSIDGFITPCTDTRSCFQGSMHYPEFAGLVYRQPKQKS